MKNNSDEMSYLDEVNIGRRCNTLLDLPRDYRRYLLLFGSLRSVEKYYL
jgi:hypothetical protein